MNKILFITTRNILNTSGELRLIKNRAKTLFMKWGVITDFIVLCSNKKINKNKESMEYSCKVNTLGYDFYSPISVISAIKKSKKLISEQLISGEYKCIILSGIGTLSYLPVIRALNKDIKIIADIHGANEDILQFLKGNSLLKKIRQRFIYQIARYGEAKYLKDVDASLVVSIGLREYLKKLYKLKNHKFYIAPCAIEGGKFDFDERFKNRELFRNKYMIKPDEVLFIYSGGVSPWQCIDKSIKLYKEIKANCNIKCRMLILSHKIQEIVPMIKDCNEIITDSVDASVVNKILCAGDFALLIRDDIVTNNVAYPNKFLEYVQSGMKVITTPFIHDVALQVKQYDLGIVFDINKDDMHKLYDYITTIHNEDYNCRIELLRNTAFEYTMKGFVEDIILNKSMEMSDEKNIFDS